jgi:hypothetical protein
MQYLEQHYHNPRETEYLAHGPKRSTQDTMELVGRALRDNDESLHLGIPLVERALLQLQEDAVKKGMKPEEYTRMVLAITTNLLTVKAVQNAREFYDPRYSEVPEPHGPDAKVLAKLDLLARKDITLSAVDREKLEAGIVSDLSVMLGNPKGNSLEFDVANF